MKTKIIPFDVEIAKKIQAGEIEGEIKTKCGNKVRILCFDLIDPRDVSFPIVCALYSDKNVRVVRFTKCGRYSGAINSELDLVLEVPDYRDQLSTYEKEQTAFSKKDIKEMLLRQAEEDYEKALCTTRKEKLKHEFKPFDKVLVRVNNFNNWEPDFYWRKGTKNKWFNKFKDEYETVVIYYTIGDKFGKREYKECIPYEGNEHLVGTTDKPKEN